ncbi:hypothetical protein LWI29_002306 [Acer saccharum]|uniref:Uncharacterized protein n=1 Tax=Acer saccharum TaxID=4024 RepID=A0AA39RFP8_ACESA|nr:hypothetical protein LWI29_002306 [Acer saccharum]
MVDKTAEGPYLLVDQEEFTQSDVEDHRSIQVRYSSENPSFVDCENNAVDEKCLREYMTFFRIPKEVVFCLPGANAAWNPPPGCVAIFGFMFCCGVTLPISGFIARFLSSVKCAPMQLTPNAYRNLMGLYCLWRDLNFGAPTVNEIKHCLNLRKSINETVLDLDPILGKTLRVLKSVKAVSKEDARASERQGIASPDDPDMVECLDPSMSVPNVVTASSHVTAPIPKTKTDGPTRGVRKRAGNLGKRKGEELSSYKGSKTSRTLSIPLHPKKGSSEATGSEPIDSVFRDLGLLPEQKTSKNVTADPPPILQDGDFPILPDRSLDQNVPHPAANLSGFFSGEGSTRPKPVVVTGPSLRDPDPLDPSVALRWTMTGELSFGPTGDFELFIKESLTDQCQRGLHFRTMVKNLAEDKTKLLVENAKLLADYEHALVDEKKKNEESGCRIASLEKQRDSLNFRLREYKRDFETAKTELGVRAISLFKRSSAFEAFAHKEFVKGVDACKNLV